MPTIEPHQRPPACVLAIASRLAPLAAGEPDRQLRAFLTGLPPGILNATARLAARTLPAPDTGTLPAAQREDIAARLRVLQLVGTHRASPP